MKKIIVAAGLIACISSSSFAQNYISGIVSLHGDNTVSGNTTVAHGASLYFNDNKLYAQRNFINRGDSAAIIADSGTLVLSGSGTQGITGRFRISALQINNAGSDTRIVGNVNPTMVTILDSVSFGNVNNTVFNAGDSLMTLRSNEVKTARIADITNDDVNLGNAINGKPVVERFIKNRRAWRLLSPPTSADSVNDQTISEAWQEGARTPRGQTVNPHPGYGTLITRPTSNPPAATGYDDGVGAYSLHTYASNGLYSIPPNTDFTHFSPGAAYFLFVRGDRSVPSERQTSTYHTPSTSTTLRSKGSLHNGSVVNVVTKLRGNFAGVANPYACTIDFSKATIAGINNGFYVYDPTLNTIGGWVYIDGTDNYNATPAGVGAYTNPATNKLIQSGQGILVIPIALTGAVVFKESNKNVSYSLNGFRMEPLPSIAVNLYNGDSTDLFLDGAVANFDASFSKEVVIGEDIPKSININENVAFYASGQTLIKDKWPLPAPADTLPMRVWRTSAKKYRFRMLPTNMPATPQAYLFDKYLNKSTEITDNSSYDFTITKDSGSKVIDRFAIVFAGSVLPVKLTNITATLQNTGVNVQWSVTTETNIAHYEVEKAADGKTFSKIGTVAAQGASQFTYNFFDAQPYNGDNYYRVKIVEANGTFTYTSVVKVTVTGGVMTVTVYPNPVKNHLINLLFTNAPAASYLLTLYSSDGKTIMTKTIVHPGGTASYKIPAGMIAQGLYHIVISKENTAVTDIPVIVE